MPWTEDTSRVHETLVKAGSMEKLQNGRATKPYPQSVQTKGHRERQGQLKIQFLHSYHHRKERYSCAAELETQITLSSAAVNTSLHFPAFVLPLNALTPFYTYKVKHSS